MYTFLNEVLRHLSPFNVIIFIIIHNTKDALQIIVFNKRPKTHYTALVRH